MLYRSLSLSKGEICIITSKSSLLVALSLPEPVEGSISQDSYNSRYASTGSAVIVASTSSAGVVASASSMICIYGVEYSKENTVKTTGKRSLKLLHFVRKRFRSTRYCAQKNIVKKPLSDPLYRLFLTLNTTKNSHHPAYYSGILQRAKTRSSYTT